MGRRLEQFMMILEIKYKHSFNRTRRRREKRRMTVRKERGKTARKEKKREKLRID